MKILFVSLYKNYKVRGGIQAFLERYIGWQLRNSDISIEHRAISDRNVVGRGNFSFSRITFGCISHFDLIFIAGHNVPAIDFIFLRANISGIPVVHMPFYHGFPGKKRFGLSKIYFKIVRFLIYRFAKKSLFVSEAEKIEFCDDVIKSIDCVSVNHALALHFSSQLVKKPVNAKKLRVGYVGRPVTSKGFDLFCSIASSAPRHIVCCAIGPQIENNIDPSSFGILHNFNADVSDDQITEFYRQCDVIVVPSREESFGLAAIEALAMGCYVIASSHVPAAKKCQTSKFLSIIEDDFVESSLEVLQTRFDLIGVNTEADRMASIEITREYFHENAVYSVYERVFLDVFASCKNRIASST